MKLRLFLPIIIYIFLSSACTKQIKPSPVQLSARMSILSDDQAELVFYLTEPKVQRYPIAVICDGSTTQDDLSSVWRVQEFLRPDLQSLDLVIMAVEKRGIDMDQVDSSRFFANYTVSQRFFDHVRVIDHVLKNPPAGFDGRLIFIGASEGGSLVNRLSAHYAQTIATINWSGAGDWSWPDQLWAFCEQMRKEHPIKAGLYSFWHKVPKTRGLFDLEMAKTVQNPTAKRFFLGMTYKYHADAITAPKLDYQKIHAPMLIVCGTKDSSIDSCDAFAEKAQSSQAPITYWRIDGMEHRISLNKQNLIPKSFIWLKQRL